MSTIEESALKEAVAKNVQWAGASGEAASATDAIMEHVAAYVRSKIREVGSEVKSYCDNNWWYEAKAVLDQEATKEAVDATVARLCGEEEASLRLKPLDIKDGYADGGSVEVRKEGNE